METRSTRRQLLKRAACVAAGTALTTPLVSFAHARAQSSAKITVWKFGGTTIEVEFWPKQNEVFSRTYPDVALEYHYFYGQIRRSKILAGFQTRSLADVIIGFGQDIPELAGLNIIQPLDDIDREMVESWRERIVPEIWDTGVHAGKFYGLPTYVDMATFLAYNLDAFEEAGLTRPPENWQELREYAKILTKPSRPGIAFPATPAPVDINIFEGIAYANGGRIYREESNRVTFTDPGVVDALQLYVDLVRDGSTPPAASLTETVFRDVAQLFAQGRVAMWIGMSWLNTPWPVPAHLRWAGILFPRPARPSGSSSPVATLMDPTAILMVGSLSRNPTVALRYIDFWAHPDRLSLWDGDPEFARVPALKSAYDSPVLKKRWPEWVRLYKAGKLFEGSQPLPRFLGISQVESHLATAIQEAVLGRKTPRQALADAERAAQGQMDLLRG